MEFRENFPKPGTKYRSQIDREVLKRLRKDLVLNQKEFAEAIGVSGCAVCLWESGKRHPSRLATRSIELFCERMNLQLFGEVGKVKRKGA